MFNYREKIVSSDDLLEWLRPFCGNDSLAVKPRIRVLQILEQAFHLSDEDSKLLVYFRTQAVLRACWPEAKVLILIAANYSIRLFLCNNYMKKCWSAVHGCDASFCLEANPTFLFKSSFWYVLILRKIKLRKGKGLLWFLFRIRSS